LTLPAPSCPPTCPLGRLLTLCGELKAPGTQCPPMFRSAVRFPSRPFWTGFVSLKFGVLRLPTVTEEIFRHPLAVFQSAFSPLLPSSPFLVFRLHTLRCGRGDFGGGTCLDVPSSPSPSQHRKVAHEPRPNQILPGRPLQFFSPFLGRGFFSIPRTGSRPSLKW